MPDPRDFYDTLGVGRDASASEIQSAYRKLARTYHPDVNKSPEAEDRFKDVSEAYDVLSDPETRRRYDAFGPNFRQVPEGVSPEAWARAGAAGTGDRRRSGAGGAGPSGFGGAGEGPWFSAGDVDFDFDDLLGGMFGRRGRGATPWGPVPGADQEVEITLTVEEAFRGVRRSITLSGPDDEQATLEVTIPPGVTNGQRIRLAGQGGHGSARGARGDLYLVVRLLPHRRYRVDGRDLFVELRLTPWEAALGTTVAVETPSGEAKLRVGAGTSSGRRLRLRGQGLPNPKGTPGNLFAEVRIMVPSSLSAEERGLLEELAATSTFDPRRHR
jgi:curved DNA-binding protein